MVKMMKLRKNDQVVILAGKDKGKRGKIIEVFSKANKVLVDGINLVKKHQKPNPARSVNGWVNQFSLPISASNVAVINPVTNKGDRVGYRILADGRKVRYFKSTNDILDA